MAADLRCALTSVWGGAQAALLAAFIGHEGWGLQRGWSEGSGDPCAAAAEWEGLTCDGGGRVTEIDLYSRPSVGGELGSALGELTALTELCAARADPLSLPSLLSPPCMARFPSCLDLACPAPSPVCYAARGGGQGSVGQCFCQIYSRPHYPTV